MKKCIYLFNLASLIFQFGFGLSFAASYFFDVDTLFFLLFSIFRVEAVLLSGPISLIALILLIISLIKSKESVKKLDVCALFANIEYLAFYVWFLSVQ